jgi:hypothetical protein
MGFECIAGGPASILASKLNTRVIAFDAAPETKAFSAMLAVRIKPGQVASLN